MALYAAAAESVTPLLPSVPAMLFPITQVPEVAALEIASPPQTVNVLFEIVTLDPDVALRQAPVAEAPSVNVFPVTESSPPELDTRAAVDDAALENVKFGPTRILFPPAVKTILFPVFESVAVVAALTVIGPDMESPDVFTVRHITAPQAMLLLISTVSPGTKASVKLVFGRVCRPPIPQVDVFPVQVVQVGFHVEPLAPIPTTHVPEPEQDVNPAIIKTLSKVLVESPRYIFCEPSQV
jgi:hypothetical protein